VRRLSVFAWVMIAVVAIAAGPPAGADVMSPRAFTDAFAATATAVMPFATVTIKGDLWLETRDAGGKTTTTDLSNAYQLYRADPAQLVSVIRRYLTVLADTVSLSGAALPVDRSRIVPVLKSNAWVEGVRQQRRATPAAQLIAEAFTGELTIVYVEDRPSSMRFLMAGDEVGDTSKLRTLALENLNRLLPKIEMRQGADGVFLIGAGGSYEASLLLADALWSSGQIKVDGDIVVAAPAKDAVLVTGSRNPAGIARLRALAADLAARPYGLTSVLYVYRGGKFARFED